MRQFSSKVVPQVRSVAPAGLVAVRRRVRPEYRPEHESVKTVLYSTSAPPASVIAS